MANRKAVKPDSQKTAKAKTLDETLLSYENMAKSVLNWYGYKTEKGAWRKGYDADALAGSTLRGMFTKPDYQKFVSEYEKLKPIVQIAVQVLDSIRECRRNVSLGKLEEAVLDMEHLVYMYKMLPLKVLQKKGGERPKSRRAIKAAVVELVQDGYESAKTIWEHLKECSENGKPYVTESVEIDFVPDHARKEGYLRENDNDKTLTTYRTFQNYVTAAKKSETNLSK